MSENGANPKEHPEKKYSATADGYKPLIYEPRCKVCNAPSRPFIDKLAAQGYRPAAIWRIVKDHDAVATYKSIERHIKRHLDLEQAELREIIERRAEQAKIIDDQARSSLVTRHALLDALVSRGFKNVTNPNERIYMKDVLNAIDVQSKLETAEASKIAEDAYRQLQAIIQAVKELVPKDSWPDIALRAKEIHESPLLEIPAADVVEEIL